MSERITETVGIYTVHALRIGKNYKARALAGDRRVADGEGDTAAAAIAAVRGKLDQLRPQRRSDVPLAREYGYALALLGRKINAGQWAMLRAHAAAPDRTLDATELAEAAGYADYSAANLQYGKLGAAIAKLLDIPLPTGPNGKPVATHALATGSGEDDQAHWRWTMHEELAEAVIEAAALKEPAPA